MRSPENVLESLKSKACNKSYKYERLYRNLYNPQFYLLAYQRIQAKPGNMTAGTDGKTIDGMGMARINALIEKMRDFSYQPNPARRTYIPKSNGKINKNERTLFPRFVVVGFLYSFCSSRQDFQIFFAHTVKHSIELTAARGFLLFPFREKELVY